MLRNGVFLQRRRHFVGQGRTLRSEFRLVVYIRQYLGGLAQRRDGHKVRGHEEPESRGVVRGSECRDNQPHGLHGIAAPHMAAGVQLAVGRAQEDVVPGALLHLLFAQRAENSPHGIDPRGVENRRIARRLPVVVRKTQRIAVGVDLPFAFENHRVGFREVRLVVFARRRDVESIGVGVDIDQLHLPPDNPRDHPL